MNLLYWYIGVNGYEGDGDITKSENLEEFQRYVLNITKGQGVHFVMADGVSFFIHCSSSHFYTGKI